MITVIRRRARKWYADLPKHRRVRGFVGFDNVRLLQLRNIVPGLRRLPIVVTRSSDGLRFRLTADPVDEEVADSVTRKHRDVYFPPGVDRAQVRVVLDVGAHHGHFAIAAAHEFPDAHVISMEPSAAACDELRRHVALNELDARVTVVEAALGAESGKGSLLHDGSGSWGHSLVAVRDQSDVEAVTVSSLDEVVGDADIDFVKCNAEGGEVALIDAFEASGTRPETMVLMVHPELIDVEELRSKVTLLGYDIVDAVDGDHPAWICSLRPR